MAGFGFALAGGAPAAGLERLFAKGEAGAWYDVADRLTLFEDAAGTVPAAIDGPVGRIADKSGNGNHAVQAAAQQRPVLRQEAGRLFLEFDGVDDFMAAQFALPQPWDRVSAVRQLSWTNLDRIFGGATDLTGRLLQSGAEPNIAIHSGGQLSCEPDPAVGVQTGVVTERHAGAASRVAFNGFPYALGNAGTMAANGISLAASIVDGAGINCGHVRIYGVLAIGRALGEAETGAVRRFLAARAGVAI